MMDSREMEAVGLLPKSIKLQNALEVETQKVILCTGISNSLKWFDIVEKWFDFVVNYCRWLKTYNLRT